MLAQLEADGMIKRTRRRDTFGDHSNLFKLLFLPVGHGHPGGGAPAPGGVGRGHPGDPRAPAPPRYVRSDPSGESSEREEAPSPSKVLSPESIITLYEETCPSLIPVVRSQPLAAALRRASGIDVDTLRGIFAKAEASVYITSKWRGCTLLWILQPENWLKLANGAYDNAASR
jgi:hypothetical protein